MTTNNTTRSAQGNLRNNVTSKLRRLVHKEMLEHYKRADEAQYNTLYESIRAEHVQAFEDEYERELGSLDAADGDRS